MLAAGYKTHIGLHSGGHGTELSSLRDLHILLLFFLSLHTPLSPNIDYACDSKGVLCHFSKAEVTKPFAILCSVFKIVHRSKSHMASEIIEMIYFIDMLFSLVVV